APAGAQSPSHHHGAGGFAHHSDTLCAAGGRAALEPASHARTGPIRILTTHRKEKQCPPPPPVFSTRPATASASPPIRGAGRSTSILTWAPKPSCVSRV